MPVTSGITAPEAGEEEILPDDTKVSLYIECRVASLTKTLAPSRKSQRFGLCGI